ncbi:MAG TPA: two-component regulator propeller domain-containing protein, partial [Chitinophagaceae bacterium]|nr:two-component regulator propeller domain-containing protein [Chitinophagaceae bacterium]
MVIRPTIIFLFFYQLLATAPAFSQQIKFNRVFDGAVNHWVGIPDIAQDHQGYIWFSTYGNGIYRYDGFTLTAFTHDSTNTNSISSNRTSSLIIDHTGNIWVGTFRHGLNKFNPDNNTVIHYRHNPNDISSLGCDTISGILEDREGNIWLATYIGLDHLDTKTGKFYHYRHDEKDPSSISNDHVWQLYED